jgi:hypothetical protein
MLLDKMLSEVLLPTEDMVKSLQTIVHLVRLQGLALVGYTL